MITRYVKAHNDTLIKYPYLFSDLQSDNPYTNYGDNYDVAYWFPMTESAMENNYALHAVIDLPQPSYDENTQICVQNTVPEYISGEWFLGWTVTAMTPAQHAQHDAQVMQANKTEADKLLTATDWTSIPSVADPAQSNPYLMNQDAFLTYRSEVRDIAVNPPSTPVTEWPVLPAEVWSS